MFAGWVTVTARDCTIVQIMGWWAGPAAAAPLLCNDTADGDPLAIEALQFIDCNDEIWCQGK